MKVRQYLVETPEEETKSAAMIMRHPQSKKSRKNKKQRKKDK